jgi:hypothetical protein
MDGLSIVYLAFCFIICGFGIWVYAKKKNDVPLYLGIAFGLFGIDRLIAYLDLESGLDILGHFFRVAAYLIVLFALYRALAKK